MEISCSILVSLSSFLDLTEVLRVDLKFELPSLHNADQEQDPNDSHTGSKTLGEFTENLRTAVWTAQPGTAQTRK